LGYRGDQAFVLVEVQRVPVRADASDADLAALLAETDRVAEIQNTVRQGCPVTFEGSA
jgi:hypothetical protein